MQRTIPEDVFQRVKRHANRRAGRLVDLFAPTQCWLVVRIPHQPRVLQQAPKVQVRCNRPTHSLFPKLLELQTTIVADLIDQFSYKIETVERIASFFFDTVLVLSICVVEPGVEASQTAQESQHGRVRLHTSFCAFTHSGTEKDSVERAAAEEAVRKSESFHKVTEWLEHTAQKFVLFDDIPLN